MTNKELAEKLKAKLDVGMLEDHDLINVCDQVILLAIENLDEDVQFFSKLLSTYMELRRKYTHSKFAEKEETDDSAGLFGR